MNNKFKNFPKISVIISIIFYALYFIGNNTVHLAETPSQFLLSILADITFLQLFTLAILYIGVPLITGILIGRNIKYKTVSTILIILAMLFDIIGIPWVLFILLCMGVEGQTIHFLWAYPVSFVLLILQLIYNLKRKA